MFQFKHVMYNQQYIFRFIDFILIGNMFKAKLILLRYFILGYHVLLTKIELICNLATYNILSY